MEMDIGMNTKSKILFPCLRLLLILSMTLTLDAWAIYTGDAAVHNGVTGKWDLPLDRGSCVTGIKSDGTIVTDASKKSRPDCLTATFPNDAALTGSAACVSDSDSNGGSHYWVSTCVAKDGTKISLSGLDRTGAMCEQAIAAAGKASQGWECVDSGFTSKSACEAAGDAYAWDSNLAKCVDTGKTLSTCSGAGGSGGSSALTWTSKSLANACTGAWTYLGPAGDGAPGFCYTAVNLTSLYGSADACPTSQAGYAWSNNKCTYAYGISGYANANIAKKDGSGTYAKAGDIIDLSQLGQGQCLLNGASWSTGTTKSGTASLATTPNPSIVANVTGVRAGCLECHNGMSQFNAFAERRGKESYLLTGHKNMLRKVTPGMNWAGPDGKIYTFASSGQTLDFSTGTATGAYGSKPLWYIFGDWITPAEVSLDTVVETDPGIVKYNGASAYSCAACHTTGWSNPAAGVCTDSTKTSAAACAGADYLDHPRIWVKSEGVQGASYVPPEPLASFPTYSGGITGKWDREGIMCSRCHASSFPAAISKTIKSQADCVAATGSWSSATSTCSLTGTHNNTASPTGDGVTSPGPQQIVRLCFGCHQSLAKDQSQNEAKSELPMTDLNLGNIAVWTTYRRDFAGHIIGNNFLNSPHARMTGGTIYPNLVGKYDIAGGTYNSAFGGYICRSSTARNGGSILSTVIKSGKVERIESLEDCNAANGKPALDFTDYGYWQAETQGSCATCHNVHQSLVEEVGAEEPFYRECTDCHKKNLANVNHPKGPGTPLENMQSDPDSACETCHMPKAGNLQGNENYPSHLFRINADASYNTFPSVEEFEAAGVCSDSSKNPLPTIKTRTACTPGVCSVTNKLTKSECDAAYGKWTAESTNAWTVTAIAKTAPETYDGGVFEAAVWNDLDMTCGQCHGGSAGASKTKNGAPYISKNVLSMYAKDMHGNAPPKASFRSVIDNYTVTLTDTSIDDSILPSNVVAVDWGDGTSSQGNAGKTLSHTYAGARKYHITYIVRDSDGVKSRKKLTIDVPRQAGSDR
jgi:hypothetical protein